MAKKGVKSQKYKKKGFCDSYWDQNKQKPTTIAYLDKVQDYYDRKEDGIYNAGRVSRAEGALLHDAFAHVFKRNMLADPTVRKENLQVLRHIIRKCKDYNILYIPSGERPKGAKRFPTASRLYLVRDNCGMPFLDFLLCLKGDDNLTPSEERFAALSDLTHIPIGQMKNIALTAIAPFFREEAVGYNTDKDEDEYGFYDPTPSFMVWNIHAKTVNIKR